MIVCCCCGIRRNRARGESKRQTWGSNRKSSGGEIKLDLADFDGWIFVLEKKKVPSRLAWEAALEVLEVISCGKRRRINELTLHQDEALGP